MSTLYQSPAIETELSFRAASDGTTVFEGYTALFNRDSKPILDESARGRPYVETILPNAFRRSLSSRGRITFVVDHDNNKMISSSPNGPLRLAEDSTGLHVESPWPRTDYADNVRALHEAGEKLGMSVLYGFPRSGPESPQWNANYTRRSVPQAMLRHASVLATLEPAFDGTTGSFRALAALTEADVEDVDAVMDALREGRRLDDGEYQLLTKLAEAVKPEAGESATPVAEPPDDEAGRAALDRWTARLAAMEAELSPAQ